MNKFTAFLQHSSLYTWIAYGILGIVVVWFLLVSHRDIITLFTQRIIGDEHAPERGRQRLGLGVLRIWAIARTAIAEAWWSKVWVVPLLWLAACLIINTLVRPFDPRERLGLYLRVLLSAQELIVLVMVGVLACFSLPRERERRTIITTGAKPISRLELFLGKVVGFSTVGAGLLLVMGIFTAGYAWMADWQVRREAGEMYARAWSDYEKKVAGAGYPSEGLRDISANGVLRAENLITVRGDKDMQIAGRIDYSQDPPLRFLRGGSSEKLIYRFGPVYPTPNASITEMPYVALQFAAASIDPRAPLPPTVDVNIVVSRVNQPQAGASQERRIPLGQNPGQPGLYYNAWLLDDLPASEIYSLQSTQGGNLITQERGPVDITVQCMTAGVYLMVAERNKDDSNVAIVGVDAARYGGRAGERMIALPTARPRMLGFEKRDLQQIQGPDSATPHIGSEVASWRFRAADLNGVPIKTIKLANGEQAKSFEVSMVLDLEKNKNPTLPTLASIMAYNQLDPTHPEVIRDIPVQEKQITKINLPATLLSHDKTTGKVDADVIIDIRCETSGHWLGAKYDSVRIEQPPSWFIVNLFKSEAVIFCEVVLLVTIAVAASIRLGGAVAMLVTGVSYMLGNLFVFVQEQVLTGGDSIFTPSDQQALAGNTFYRVLSGLQGVSLHLVYLFVNMLPDFTRFDPKIYIIDSRNMPWSVVGLDVLWVGIYALPFVALAYLLIRKQELA